MHIVDNIIDLLRGENGVLLAGIAQALVLTLVIAVRLFWWALRGLWEEP